MRAQFLLICQRLRRPIIVVVLRFSTRHLAIRLNFRAIQSQFVGWRSTILLLFAVFRRFNWRRILEDERSDLVLGIEDSRMSTSLAFRIDVLVADGQNGLRILAPSTQHEFADEAVQDVLEVVFQILL